MLAKLFVAAVLCTASGATFAATARPPGMAMPESIHSPPRAVCAQRPLDYNPENEQLKLRGFLAKGQFGELDKELDAFRKTYGKSECSDRLFGIVFLGLMDGAPGMKARYDAWVAKAPRSAYALSARGSHFLSRAVNARGADWAANTPDRRFEAMNGFLAQSNADLSKSLALDPTLTVSMGHIITGKSMGSPIRDVLSAYGGFAARVPNSYVLASAMLSALQPRWGGDIDVMLKFAHAEADRPGNNADTRRLVSLASCLAAEDSAARGRLPEAHAFLSAGMRDANAMDFNCYFSQGMLARAERQYTQAAAAFANNRMRAGPVNFLSKEADSLVRDRRYGEAELLYTQGIRFKTESPTLFCGRAEARLQMGKLKEASQDVKVGLRTDPTDENCLRIEKRIREKL
jgi:tetratricopeptide (TPR) repeat protein